MKKITKISLLFIMVLIVLLSCSISGFCATENSGTYTDENGNVYEWYVDRYFDTHITKFTASGENAHAILPERLGGYLLSSTALESAFQGNTDIKSVQIPNIQAIPQNAFKGCTNLEEVNLPVNLNTIGKYAFYGTALKAVHIPRKVTSIGAYAFAECSQLETLTFEEGIGVDKLTGETGYNRFCKLNEFSFAGSGIKNLNIPKGVAIIGDSVFENCQKLETVYVDGEKLDEWYTYSDLSLFANCSNLKEAFVRYNITDNMFENCTSLEKVTSYTGEIGTEAFKGCSSLTTVDITLVRTIGDYAFENCESVATLDFPQCTDIGEGSFKGCSSLVNISFSNEGVSSIDACAFEGCASLKSLDTLNLSKIKTIKYNAFKDCTSLEEVDFSKMSSLRLMTGDGIFENCTSLEEIVIPDGFKVIENSSNTFRGCIGVKYIYIGDSYTRTNFSVFGFNGRLPNLEKIEVSPNNPKYFVADNVLYYNNTTVIPSEQVGVPDELDGYYYLVRYPALRQGEKYDTADGLPDLSKYELINNGQLRINYYAFSDTKYLKHLHIDQYLLEDDYISSDSLGYRFAWSSIEKITFTPIVFDEGMESETTVEGFSIIYAYDFYESDIRELNLLEYGVEIGSYAFVGTNNFEKIEFGDRAKIYQYAFANCTSIKEINFGTAAQINAYSFEGCSALTQIRFKTVNYISQGAFKNCENLIIADFNQAMSNISLPSSEYDCIFENCPKLTIFCDEKVNIYDYAIEHNIPVNAFSVDFYENADFQYTGKEIQPEMLVGIRGMVLVKNVDYIAEYENNTEIGYATVTIKFINNFDGMREISRTFKITRRNIDTSIVEYVVDNEYSGEEVKPKVVVKNGNTILVEGVDYTIKYNSGTDAGSMFFTIIGKGNYTGSVNCYYNIIRRDITEATVSKNNDMVYTGAELMPKPVITWNEFTLVEGVDYEIRYFENVNSGYGTMVIYGLGNFCGTQRVQFRIFGKGIENAVISSVPDQIYTGKEITPEISVTIDGVTLVKDTDYTVKYENNTEKGIATVVISGIGNYSGVAKQSFNIVKNSVYSFTVFSETQMTETYDGTALKPEMEVYFGTELLTEGVDYTVSLENNVNAGTATVTVIGMGLYEGERSYDFTILPCEITENDISVSGNMEFFGSAVEPEISVFKNGITLVEGEDYTVSYFNNNSVGTALVTIEGMGNYCDTVNLEYEIYESEKEEETPVPDDNENDENNSQIENDTPVEKPETPEKPADKEESDKNNGTQNNTNGNDVNADIKNETAENNDGTDAQNPVIPNTDGEGYKAFNIAWMLISISCQLAIAVIVSRKKKLKI